MPGTPVLLAATFAVWSALLLLGVALLRRGRRRTALAAANASALAALPAIMSVGALLLLGSAALGAVAARAGRRAG